MYYIFQPTIDFKKETQTVGDFEVTMIMNNVVVETSKKLSKSKVETLRSKLETKIQNKFNINNINLKLINLII